jgi:acetoin utilization protein AcuC
MDPTRLALTMRLVEAFDLPSAPGVSMAAAPPAGDSTLRLVHGQAYIDAVRRTAEHWADPAKYETRYGLGTEDNPAFAGMHNVSALIAGQSVAAAEAIWPVPGTPADQPRPLHAVNFAGGLHHAMPDRASGFCIYNDVAIAIARLLELGAERVAYIDVDVHHGDGVQHVFWNDPRVLTISVHEHPATLFPQTGWVAETGGPAAPGSAVNIPLPAGTGDSGWLRAFHATVPELLESFQPQVLVTQHGADTHIEDPLAHFAVTLDAQRTMTATLHDLAHQYADGRWLALGGGGYAVVEVVPRTWTHLTAIAASSPLDPALDTPEEWRAEVYRLTRQQAPRRMTDGRDPVRWDDFAMTGYDPSDRLDQAVLAVRREVFPLHGMLP